jgi:hypothetical protein
VSDLLISNGWATAAQVASLALDDQVAALKTELNFNLNGTFHTIVELSSR